MVDPTAIGTGTDRGRAQALRYVLGHSEDELDRLAAQARVIEPITRRFFSAAGIARGMRVLDVGSGIGDVAFLAAELVGDAGEVVGVERAPVALQAARRRANSLGAANVRFLSGDPAESTFDRPFDAIVGRYVLLFQPDPVAWLRGLLRHLAPGGVVVFQEPEWARAHSAPHVPSWQRCCRLVVEGFIAGGADPEMGTKLPAVYAAAGLPAPKLAMETVIGAGAGSIEQVRLTTDVLVTLLPELERRGHVAPGEIDPATLADHVMADIAARGSVFVGRSEIGAWSTKPA
ncbi:class I SAM-dependent methyltransferase [Mycobacterium sp. SM1]|uniref:class I SAM-dependent methyltransferase n=1 Tax=Mycobacterium sp. SM1 TaxID=2816243 RepID=UPI001BD1029A|nr:class I SAM-dependent methyltransferase [Mycobacterium sp. SM1]MBS4728917.1 class I SAM-dependent methyltransferase [Mycobacterium sp. SM1]